MVEGDQRDATRYSAPARAPWSLLVNIMRKTVGCCNIYHTATPTLRGPSTEVKMAKMAIFHHLLVGHIFDHADPF